MSGEDFEVKTPEGELVLKINGGNRVPIPGVVPGPGAPGAGPGAGGWAGGGTWDAAI